MLCISVLLLSLLPVLKAQNDSLVLTNVTQAFSQAQIVPDVLPVFAPTALVNITFPASSSNGVSNVTPGALLTEDQTATKPTVFLLSSDTPEVANQTFLLALVDPDAPSPQDRSSSQFLHFLGGDFRMDVMSSDPTQLTNQSAALMDFVPPTPPAGSPPHRYVLVVYDQPNNFTDTSSSFVNASTPRNNFNLTIFASSVGLADPIAGNFFLVGPDTNNTSTVTSLPTPTDSSSTETMPTSIDTVTSTDSVPAPTISSSGTAAVPVATGISWCLSLVILVMGRELWNL